MQDQLNLGSAPIGTYEELIEARIDPAKFGSCSRKAPGNVGCPWFDQCRFKEWRDKLGGKRGPCNIGYDITLPTGHTDGKKNTCFGFYDHAVHTTIAHSHETGIIVDNFVFEGEKILVKGRRRVHQDAKSNCHACKTGTCYKMEDWQREEMIEPFKRLGHKAAQSAFAKAKREKFMEKLEKQRELEAIERFHGAEKPKSETIPDHEGPSVARLNR